MKFNVLKQDGKKGSTITVDDSVFGIKPNKSCLLYTSDAADE